MIGRVAERIGYQSIPAFTRAFKRATGPLSGGVSTPKDRSKRDRMARVGWVSPPASGHRRRLLRVDSSSSGAAKGDHWLPAATRNQLCGAQWSSTRRRRVVSYVK